MRDHRTDIIHASGSTEDRILLRNVDGQAVSVGESLRDFCSPFSLTALESVISFPSLSFQCLSDVVDDLRSEYEKEIVVKSFVRLELKRHL